ncbi:response regulator transcription factor [Nocardia sp. alder85J]|nr:response regulator transcription factor [Nocardia sp. alder85J]MCX4098385.1 response regulator transcription factor [Nocardia sp. alder85J]
MVRGAVGVPAPMVLIVDDECDFVELLSTALRFAGWEVCSAVNGTSALAAISAYSPDVVVLDVTLPDIDGYSVARRFRESGYDQPVLFLSARDAVEDRLAGLAAGGDDYVGKPFSLEELIARLHMLLRRARTAYTDEPGRLRFADLVLDIDAHTVHRTGHQLWLPAIEFALLRYLMVNAGKVVSRRQILERVWGDPDGCRGHVIDNSVGRLRRRIDKYGSPLIHTVRGVGYVLRSPGETR